MVGRAAGRRALAPVLLAAALLGACTGGDDDDAGGGDRQDYVDAFAEASDSAESGVLTAEQEACFAESLVDAIGVTRLSAAVSPAEIRDRNTPNLADLGVEVNEDDGAAIYEKISQCADLRTVLIQSTLGTDAIADSVTQCFDQRLSEDMVRQFMVAGLTEASDRFAQSRVFGQLRDVFSRCTPQ